MQYSQANPSPFPPSPFASHMATSVGSQFSQPFASSFASQVSMSPQSYLMPGLSNSQAAAQGQFLRPPAGGTGSQNFYGATPPVIQHTPDDHRQMPKKGLHHFYGATPPVIQHSNDEDVEMTDG